MNEQTQTGSTEPMTITDAPAFVAAQLHVTGQRTAHHRGAVILNTPCRWHGDNVENCRVAVRERRLLIAHAPALRGELTPGLREPHGSFPANPLLAEPLYLTKYIERMGTGTRDMTRLCREANLREPQYAVRDGFVQTLWRPTPQVTPQATPQAKALETAWLETLGDALRIPTPQATPQVAQQVANALAAATEAASRDVLQDAMRMKDREHFRQTYLEPLLTAGWLERTIPDKPTSPNQKYRLTEKGRAWLAAQGKEGKK